GAGGGGREVEGVDPAAGLVDGVAAQRVIRVEAVRVVAGTALQQVVARAPLEGVAAGTTDQRVIAAVAGNDRPRQGAVGLVHREVVVAAAAADDDRARVGDGRWPALDGDSAVIDEDVPGRVAGDDDGVVLAIAENGQQPVRGGERGCDSRPAGGGV